jgi:hypothetical protein
MACEADAVSDTPGARRRLGVDGTRDEVNGGLGAEAVRRTWDAFLGPSIRLVGPSFTCNTACGVFGVARKADARVRVDRLRWREGIVSAADWKCRGRRTEGIPRTAYAGGRPVALLVRSRLTRSALPTPSEAG